MFPFHKFCKIKYVLPLIPTGIGFVIVLPNIRSKRVSTDAIGYTVKWDGLNVEDARIVKK